MEKTHLRENCREENGDEVFVFCNIFEDVDLVVELSSVDFVENLHEHKHVENDGVVLAGFIFAMPFVACHEPCASRVVCGV